MPRLTGRVVLVQENRFLLEDDAGGKRPFVVSPALPFDPEDLRRLARAETRIAVGYSEPEGVVAGRAEHIEPVESPARNALYAQQDNPVSKKWVRDDNRYHTAFDERYPYAPTTYRVTEHHSGGTPTRSVPLTAELQPEGFAEIPPELARRLGIANRDWVVISTARGEVETRALVTGRLRPLQVDGRSLFQVGLLWHYGWSGYATGAIANTLTALVGEPNTSIHENKSLTCNLRKGRLGRAGEAAHGDAARPVYRARGVDGPLNAWPWNWLHRAGVQAMGSAVPVALYLWVDVDSGHARLAAAVASLLVLAGGLLSSIFGTEFPDGGLQWQRVA